MSSIRGRIDQNIIRFFLQTALDHSLQILIFDFKFFERQIIHIDNKLVIPVFHLCDNIIQILELVFVRLYNTKSLIIILIQDTLDA